MAYLMPPLTPATIIPIAIPNDRVSRPFPNRNVFLCAPSVPEPKLDHSVRNSHSNHQGDRIVHNSIERVEEGVRK
jgi:hypothetical protein